MELDKIPGLTEAVADAQRGEAQRRDAVWLELPPEFICDCEVRPLTPRHLLMLRMAGSPFILGGPAYFEDVSMFLWIVSTSYEPGITVNRERFIAWSAGVKFEEAVTEISRYLDETFADALPSRGGSGGSTKDAPTSFMATLVDELGSEHGWTEAVILDYPFVKLNQLRRRIALRYNPKLPLFNAADKVRSKIVFAWIKEQRVATVVAREAVPKRKAKRRVYRDTKKKRGGHR